MCTYPYGHHAACVRVVIVGVYMRIACIQCATSFCSGVFEILDEDCDGMLNKHSELQELVSAMYSAMAGWVILRTYPVT